MESKKQNLAILSSVVLYTASFLPYLSFLLLFFLVPLFVLLDNNQGKLSIHWAAGLTITLILGQLIGNAISNQSFQFGFILYPIGLVLTLSLGIYISDVLKGSIKTTALLSYWLGYNYLILKLIPEWSSYFTFNNLYNENLNWTAGTGFLGIAAWALISNVIISKRLGFDPKLNVDNPIILIISILIISVPFWINNLLNVTSEPIDQSSMFLLYSQSEANSSYLQSGEWLARTCAWLAVLLSIYGFVKLKIKK